MKPFYRLNHFAALLLGLLVSLQVSVQVQAAGDKPNLLIMGEDFDPDTIPRSSDVFRRVLNMLSEQFITQGYSVLDETAVTMDNFAQGRERRTDAEMIDIARSVKRPSIDVVVFFSIYAHAMEKGYTTKAKARVSGRILNVNTGERLGNIELDYPGGWNVPPKCNRICIVDSVGEHASIIAQDIGAVLTTKLNWMVTGGTGTKVNPNPGISAFTLIFDNFTADEMSRMEEYLVHFSGYQSHSVESTMMTRFEYWLKADIGTAKLNSNLNKLLSRLDVEGMVRSDGRTYTIKKIGLRGDKPVIDPSEW